MAPSTAAAAAAVDATASVASSATQPSSAIGRRVAAALSTTDFLQPLPPPFVLDKDPHRAKEGEAGERDSKRSKIIKTAKHLYFNIMGKVDLEDPLYRKDGGGGGGGAYAIYSGDREPRMDRDGLLDLIKTKGVRLDSIEVLKFLRMSTEERLVREV